jgi:hypothetical protein
MILAHERGSGEIAEKEAFDLLGPRAGVIQAFPARLHGQRAKIAIGKRAKGGFADSNHGDRAHQ